MTEFTHTGHRTYRASPTFPVVEGEVITVRDGKGRAVERWVVKSVEDSKSHRRFAVAQHGYYNTARL